MKARIKTNGKIVEVISRFMPRKRNAASRDWVCNLSDGTCIDESQLKYIEERVEGLEEAAEEYNKQVIKETKCHHNALTYAEGYEDALLLIPDAFIAGAEWMKAKMIEEAVECMVMDFSSNLPRPQVDILLDPGKYHTGDKVKVIVIKED